MDKKTFLVVDDDAENLDLLVERFTIKAARNGQIALKIAQSPNPPNLVLLDIIMPGMDGVDVCSELKSNSVASGIPVIFLSGEIAEEERKRGVELGAVAYLTKPVEPDKLMVAIEAALAA